MTEPDKAPAPEVKKRKRDKTMMALVTIFIGMLLIVAAMKLDNPKPPQDELAATNHEMTEQTTAPMASDATTSTDAVSAEAPAASKFPIAQAVGKTIGNPAAPVKIMEFSSLTCGHCAHFHNQTFEKFREKYIDSGLVYMEFHEFPLNKPAFDATLVANCLPKDQYFGFISMLFQTQDHWAFESDYLTPLKQSAKLAGMSSEDVDACIADTAARDQLTKQIEADVKQYNLQSTPTFIVNDGAQTIMGAQPLEAFSAVIDPMLPGAKKAEDDNRAATEPTATPTQEGTPAP